MGHAPGRSNGAGALCCLRHHRRLPGGPSEGRVAFQPPFDLRHGDDPQTSTTDDPQLGLDVPLERRLAHADGFGGLLNGQAEARGRGAVMHSASPVYVQIAGQSPRPTCSPVLERVDSPSPHLSIDGGVCIGPKADQPRSNLSQPSSQGKGSQQTRAQPARQVQPL